jgi:hypothetical protein
MNSLLLSDLDKKVQQRFLDEIEAVLKSPPNLLGLENIPKSVHVTRVGPNEVWQSSEFSRNARTQLWTQLFAQRIEWQKKDFSGQ